jgi:hypothetical protein
MRPPFAPLEADLHKLVGACLAEHGLPCKHEARLGDGCRIDYLVGDVGVEIKKGKPKTAQVVAQLSRYAHSACLGALIVVSWRRVALPALIGGKPVHTLVLGQLWGVSLP